MALPAPDLLLSPDLLPEGSAHSYTPSPASGPTVFQVQITDLYGTVLTWTDALGVTHEWIEQYTNVSLTVGVSQDRAATVTLSLYHPAVAHLITVNEGGDVIAALNRMIRIKYRGTTRIWGLVTAPKFSTEKATVEIGIQGPTYKLRHRELNLGDPIVGSEEDPVHNPSDHSTIKAVVEAAYDTTSQYAENIPDIGVKVTNVSGVDAPEAFWTDIQRGRNNMEVIDEVASSAYGGEYDVVPHDPTEDELPFDTTLVEVIP